MKNEISYHKLYVKGLILINFSFSSYDRSSKSVASL